MRTTYLCDFDGTIAPTDIGAALIRRFSSGDPERHRALLADWTSGAIGHRELTVAECALLRVTEAEARAFTRDFGIDPHFATFVAEAGARGDRVLIVSEGFEFYIRDQIERVGLGEVPLAANRARFEGDRMVPEFPHGADGCGRCGNCKAQHVRHARATGDHVVLVGDGLSDRCAAEVADTVHARAGLLAWCRARGIEALPFQDFAGLARCARGHRPAALPGAPGRA